MGIYCILNLISGKRYIGLSIDIARRRMQHFSNHSSNADLQKDIKLFGISNFQFSVLEYVKNESQLREREDYWLSLFTSSELYNVTERKCRIKTTTQKRNTKKRNYALDIWQADVNRIKK